MSPDRIVGEWHQGGGPRGHLDILLKEARIHRRIVVVLERAHVSHCLAERLRTPRLALRHLALRRVADEAGLGHSSVPFSSSQTFSPSAHSPDSASHSIR